MKAWSVWIGRFFRRMESTVMDLVLYRKQRVVGVDLASRGKYSYGPRFVPKAGGNRAGPRFAWKVQLWTSFHTESRGWWKWTSLCMESTVMDLLILPPPPTGSIHF